MTECNIQGAREGRARPGRVFEASARKMDLVLREQGSNGRVWWGKHKVRFIFGSENKQNWKRQDGRL